MKNVFLSQGYVRRTTQTVVRKPHPKRYISRRGGIKPVEIKCVRYWTHFSIPFVLHSRLRQAALGVSRRCISSSACAGVTDRTKPHSPSNALLDRFRNARSFLLSA